MPGAFGSPDASAVVYPVVKPAVTQAAEAFAAAPQAVADQQAALAGAQTDKAKAGEAQVQADLGKQQATDQILQRLAQTPGIEKSPIGLKMLTERLKTLGMDVPKDETGAVDMTALKVMITPPIKPWAEMDTKEKADFWTQNPKDRTIPPGAPADAASRAAVVPLTQAGINAIMSPVTKAEAGFATGKGNPKELEAAALAADKSLAARGGDRSQLDPYLNADHTALNPDYVNQKAGELVQAQVDNLHSLGIFRADEEQMKTRLLEEKKREWNNPSANVKVMATVKERQLQQQASQFTQKLDMQDRNLTARYASISNSATANMLRLGQTGINMYEAQLKDTAKAQADAQNTLDRARSWMNGYLNTPNADITNPVYTAALTRATALQKSIDDNAPKLQAAREAANNGIASVYSQITGQSAQPPPPPPPPPGQKFGSQGNQPTVVETRQVNGVTWQKLSNGEFRQVP
jgi:hypothetical protein